MKVLVLGATSAIAQEVIKSFLADGASVFLVARDQSKLDILVQHLKVLYPPAQITARAADLVQADQLADIKKQAQDFLGGIDHLFIAYGSLPNQSACEQDLAQSNFHLQVNFLSISSWMLSCARDFENQGFGHISVIGSVAGDRGRQSNYIYGAAKGALDIFCQGLRHRLAAKNIQVLLIKPGFVDTPMTANVKKNLLFAKPQTVAKSIYRAIKKKKAVLYVPFFWFWIMLLIKLLPLKIFHKTKL